MAIWLPVHNSRKIIKVQIYIPQCGNILMQKECQYISSICQGGIIVFSISLRMPNASTQLYCLLREQGGAPTKQELHSSVLRSWKLRKGVCDFSWQVSQPSELCWRRLFRVPWTARRSNQSILKEINFEFSLEVLMLKLQCYGHWMWRANSLEKTLMLGKTEGRRRRGWPRMRWLEGITD